MLTHTPLIPYLFRPEGSAHTTVFNNPLYCEPEVASSLNNDAIKDFNNDTIKDFNDDVVKEIQYYDIKDTKQLID